MNEIKQSCPHGLTSQDLTEQFGDRLPDFYRRMTGQTGMICTGQQYEYVRVHGEFCRHEDGEPFTWQCDYAPGGKYVPDACADNPHGMVVYPHDALRFMQGLPVID